MKSGSNKKVGLLLLPVLLSILLVLLVSAVTTTDDVTNNEVEVDKLREEEVVGLTVDELEEEDVMVGIDWDVFEVENEGVEVTPDGD